MALSIKNTFVSLSLSGTLLFAGYLISEAPIESAEAHVGTPVAHQETAGISTKASVSDSLKRANRTFAAPYFSFGKSSIAQGANR